jgi:hypothetical protein
MTLVELMVMALVGLILMAVIWFLISGGIRHYQNTDERLKGVQGAQLLVEHLQDDFDRICCDNEHPIQGAGQGGPESESTVTFWVFSRARIPKKLQPTPVVEQITYRFDRASHRVLRNDEPLQFARFVNVRFKYQAATTKDLVTPGQPAKQGAPNSANCLLYWISAASDERALKMAEQAGSQTEDGKPVSRRGIVTLLGSVQLGQKVRAEQFPGWIDNGPDLPQDS